MIGDWRSHADYKKFMIERINREFSHNRNSIHYFETALLKMNHLDLDNVIEDFIPLFSSTGRPSHQQPELFRSFLLMSHFKYASIDEWVAYASSSNIICALVGVEPFRFPGASTHRDFIHRLWQTEKPNRLKKRKTKSSKKHGKNKIPPKNPGIVHYLVEKALSGQVFQDIPERILQTIFMKTAVIPSISLGLINDIDKLIVSADGTCISSNASPYGHKVCKCKGKCLCNKSFADPLAKWGWDSYHERYFYGYTAYLLSVHNKELKLDLPIYIKFVEAQRSDSVTLIPALAHARYLYKEILTIDSIVADAIHDNYPTYRLLDQWNIKPFIPLNDRSDNKLQPKGTFLSQEGVPVCADGHNMTYWGYEAKKSRCKYRCPLIASNKVTYCPYDTNCNKTLYGKIVYVRRASNLRLITPVPRGSKQWKDIYKQRTASERVNNRILTDYQLEQPKRYGKAKLAFFAFFNAINIHLDALIRHSSTG